MSIDQETIGDRIAIEFSRDKVHLSHAERRRLAEMVDVAFAEHNIIKAVASPAVARGMARFWTKLAEQREAKSSYEVAVQLRNDFPAEFAKDCPSTHCNRREECASPNDCIRTERERANLGITSPDLLAVALAARELIASMAGEWPGTMSITAKKVDDALAAAVAKAKGE